jgi:hypothetical protein
MPRSLRSSVVFVLTGVVTFVELIQQLSNMHKVLQMTALPVWDGTEPTVQAKSTTPSSFDAKMGTLDFDVDFHYLNQSVSSPPNATVAEQLGSINASKFVAFAEIAFTGDSNEALNSTESNGPGSVPAGSSPAGDRLPIAEQQAARDEAIVYAVNNASLPDVGKLEDSVVVSPQQSTSQTFNMNSSSSRPTTLVSMWDRSTIVPQWMKDYVQWHYQVRSQLNESNWDQHRYLVLRCLETDHVCGGASDRLQSIPTLLRLASMSNRLFFIHWNRPAALEHFLVPPTMTSENSSVVYYGLDWRVPSFLLEERANNQTLLDLPNRKVLAMHPERALFNRLANYRVVGARLQEGDGNAQLYDSFVVPGIEPDFDTVYHDTWRLMFTPSAPVEALIEETMAQLDLQPNNYTAVHVRSLYVRDHSNNEFITQNAVNCATNLRPDDSPIYVASDSPTVVAKAVEYGQSVPLSSQQHRRRRVVGRLNGTTPLHIDRGADFRSKSTDWQNRPPSDFYDVFVDLYLLGLSSCVARNVGGYGKWGRRLSFNHSCTVEYHRTVCDYTPQDYRTVR